MERVRRSPRFLMVATGVAAAIIASCGAAALAGGSTINATAAAAGDAVTCSQLALRNVSPRERTTFTCPIPGALHGHAFELFAVVNVFNAGTSPNTARTNCTLKDGNDEHLGADDAAGSGVIALQLPVRSTAASFTVTCFTQGGTGAQLTRSQLTGIAAGSLTTHTF